MYHFKVKIDTSKLERAQAALDKAKEHYEQVKKELLCADVETNENQFIECKRCGKKSKIKNVKYAQWHWYEKPYSCMGGDCWHHGGIIIQCPKCEATEKVHKPQKYSDIQSDIEYRTLKKMLVHAIECADSYKE